MRTSLLLILALATTLVLPGCVYVTKGEFDEFWDADGDGWPLDEDCDDTNPSIFPYAADVRGDGCDADCGMEPDADGDDWPDAADCDPEDPDIHPCSALEVDGDDIDHDCDGFDSVRADTCPGTDPDYPEATALSCGGDAT